MTAHVDAIGLLTVVDPSRRTIAVAARGSTVEIGFPDLASALEAYRAFSRQAGAGRWLRLLQRELRRTDLSLEFRVRGAQVARLSGDTRGSLAGRVLRLGGTELRLGGVLRALLGG
jgi:hypothetical protein